MARLPEGVRRAFQVVAPERRIADDVEDEVAFHLEMKTEELIARGWGREAARAEAMRRFGNVEQWRVAMGEIDRGRTRSARRAERWQDLARDVRYALRGLRRTPGFTAVVVLTLALGIGANTAVFSVVNAVLLRPLPYREPERLVTIEHYYPSLNGLQAPVSAAGFADYRDRTRIFDGVAVESPWRPTLTGRSEPERLAGARVSGQYFSTLGVGAAIGRTLRPDEDEAGRNRVVVVSDGFWRRVLAGSPSAVGGTTLLLDGEQYDVVGVMPPGFRDFYFRDAELWTPLALSPEQLTSGFTNEWLQLTARLKPAVTPERAGAELAAFAEQLKRDRPDAYMPDWTLRTTTLTERGTGRLRPTLLVLLGAVGFVLLIGCANVANLLLARASGRTGEVAVRTALGADRWQVVRPLFAESMVLALVGGAAGLLLAELGVRAFAKLDPASVPGARDLRVDGVVMAFTLLVSLVTGALFGLAPVLQTWRTNFSGGLREGARGASADRAGRDVRRALVVAEIALALTLLVGAGLMIKSVSRLQGISPGFEPRNVLTLRVDLPATRFRSDTQQVAFFDELLPRVAALPGVRAVGANTSLPFGGGTTRSFQVEGLEMTEGQPEPWGDFRVVSPGYFAALRVPLLRGREFTPRDDAGAPRVAVVDEELARRYWPAADPIGKRVGFSQGDSTMWMQVVGVVGHVKQEGLDADPRVQLYLPYPQEGVSTMELAVRTAGEPTALLGARRSAVRSVDAEIPISRVRTMEQRIEASVGQRRLSMLLLTVFSAIALALASIGIYGVMAYSVAQRSRELGVRIALGATRRGVLTMVLRQGMALVLGGVAVGLLAAWALSRLLASQLYGVPPTDAATFGTVALLLAGVAALATTLPAVRATRVDPVTALRQE